MTIASMLFLTSGPPGFIYSSGMSGLLLALYRLFLTHSRFFHKFWERKKHVTQDPHFCWSVLLPFFPHLSSSISTLSDYSPARKLKRNKRIYSKESF